MKVVAIKTKKLMPPQDDLLIELQGQIDSLPERSVLVVTSKVVAIDEGRCIVESEVEDKQALIAREADFVLPLTETPDRASPLTITNNLFVGSAGIDRSNGNGYYVLLPENPMESAARIRAWAQEHYNVRELGVIITDSYSVPLRRGASVAAIGFAGIAPLTDYRGTSDIFGRAFWFEVRNVVDGLASAAGVVMGEGAECTPAALITDIPDTISFDGANLPEDLSFFVSREDDRFGILYNHLPWE